MTRFRIAIESRIANIGFLMLIDLNESYPNDSYLNENQTNIYNKPHVNFVLEIRRRSGALSHYCPKIGSISWITNDGSIFQILFHGSKFWFKNDHVNHEIGPIDSWSFVIFSIWTVASPSSSTLSSITETFCLSSWIVPVKSSCWSM